MSDPSLRSRRRSLASGIERLASLKGGEKASALFCRSTDYGSGPRRVGPTYHANIIFEVVANSRKLSPFQ